MINVKFCPVCGSQALYLQPSENPHFSADPDAFKCHACGEEFTAIDPAECARLKEIESAAEEVLANLNQDKDGGYFLCLEAGPAVKRLEEALS